MRLGAAAVTCGDMRLLETGPGRLPKAGEAAGAGVSPDSGTPIPLGCHP